LDTLNSLKIQVKELYDITDAFSLNDEMAKDLNLLKVKIFDLGKTLKDKIDFRDKEILNNEIVKNRKEIKTLLEDTMEFKKSTETQLMSLDKIWENITKLDKLKLNSDLF